MCVTEISNELSKLNSEQTEEADLSADPSSFVTVIEVNGLKPAPPQAPPK